MGTEEVTSSRSRLTLTELMSRESVLILIELLLWPGLIWMVLNGRATGAWGALAAFLVIFYLITGSLPFAHLRNFSLKFKSFDLTTRSQRLGSRDSRGQQDHDTSVILKAIVALVSVGVVGLVALALSQGWTWGFWGTFSNGLMVAGAAFLVGTMAGFLFGIPRTAQRDLTIQSGASATETQPQVNRTKLQNNTNLEQISDWLTKIIVGVGLVELRRTPELFSRLAKFVHDGMTTASAQPVPLTQAILLAIIIFFLVNGFLAGYLMTRTYLTAVFQRIEDSIGILARDASPDLASADEERPVATKVELRGAVAESAKSTSVEMLLEKVESEHLTPTSLDLLTAQAIADAYYHRGNYDRAIPFFQRIEAAGRAEPGSTLKLAIALGENGRRPEAVKLLEKLSVMETAPYETDKLLGYFLLWFPERLQESIDHTTRYLTQMGDSDGGALLNLACAHAQLFAQRGADTEEAAAHRRSALDFLQKAIARNEGLKQVARELVTFPRDFAALAADLEFQALIA